MRAITFVEQYIVNRKIPQDISFLIEDRQQRLLEENCSKKIVTERKIAGNLKSEYERVDLSGSKPSSSSIIRQTDWQTANEADGRVKQKE